MAHIRIHTNKKLSTQSVRQRVPERPRKQKKPVQVRYIVLGAFCMCLVAYAGISYLSHQQFARITQVTVSGGSLVRNEVIEEEVRTLLRGTRWGNIRQDTLLTAPLRSIESELLHMHSELSSVTLSREFAANALTVTVTEHTPYAEWCLGRGGECFLMTREGYVFSTSPQGTQLIRIYPETYENLIPTRRHVLQTSIRVLVDSVSELKKKLLTISSVSVSKDEKEAEFYVEEGWFVRSLLTENPQALSERIETIITSEGFSSSLPHLEYIDARFGNRLFYKVREASEEEVLGSREH